MVHSRLIPTIKRSSGWSGNLVRIGRITRSRISRASKCWLGWVQKRIPVGEASSSARLAVGVALDQARESLPLSIRQHLPERQSKNGLSRRAKGVVNELGPAAPRAMVGAIHDCLGRKDTDSIGDVELLRALYWCIPGSPKAVATLRDWLAKPDPRQMLFGIKDADEIWPHVPQLGPLLTQWLRVADQVKNAAEGLGAMGSNATFAIPDI